jgi:hypothetical protein
LLGQPVTHQSSDRVVVTNDTSSALAVQPAPDHRPLTQPDPVMPQQIRLASWSKMSPQPSPGVLALNVIGVAGPAD